MMRTYNFEFRAMASACEIVVMANESDQELVHQAVSQAIDEVLRIEKKYSRYLPDSIVSQINAAAGLSWVECDQETMHLLNFADAMFKTSEGLFDITSGVFRKIWKFDSNSIPPKAEIEDLLPFVNWQQMTNQKNQVKLETPGMELDFGGFGKEYAADQAAEVLKQHGIKSGLVNLAGDIQVLGPKASNEAWVIGIQHPRLKNKTIATIPIKTGALATSGDYEKFFEIDGHRYSHVIHPKTGWPVDYWQSVSVIAPKAILAGAISTIAMLMENDAIKFLDATNLDYFAVDKAGKIFQKKSG